MLIINQLGNFIKKRISVCFLFASFFLLNHYASAQCACPATTDVECSTLIVGSNGLQKSTIPTETRFTFDDIMEYQAGKTISGQTIIRVMVTDKVVGDPIDPDLDPLDNCKWNLRMYAWVTNIDAPDWDATALAAPGEVYPEINLLQVRVTNGCQTPVYDGYVNFPNANCGMLEIIESDLPNLPGGCAGTETNTAGSYITFPNEYVFFVNYTLTPGFGLKPGTYSMNIKFCLHEVD